MTFTISFTESIDTKRIASKHLNFHLISLMHWYFGFENKIKTDFTLAQVHGGVMML